MRGVVNGIDFEKKTVQFVNITSNNFGNAARIGSRIEENKTNDYPLSAETPTEVTSYSSLVLAVGANLSVMN